MQQEPNKMKPNQKDELEKKTDNEFVRKFADINSNIETEAVTKQIVL